MNRRLGLVKFVFVAKIAICSRPLISVGMACNAVCSRMSSGKREIGFGMIKSALFITFWMTRKTGDAVILVSIGFLMVIIHLRFSMLMAI